MIVKVLSVAVQLSDKYHGPMHIKRSPSELCLEVLIFILVALGFHGILSTVEDALYQADIHLNQFRVDLDLFH